MINCLIKSLGIKHVNNLPQYKISIRSYGYLFNKFWIKFSANVSNSKCVTFGHESFHHSNDFYCVRQLNTKSSEETMVRILNVAEKNDAAKNVAEILSRGGYSKREGFSKFNKIYEFETVLNGQRCMMVMTSVSGHLLTHSFTGNYKKWYGCNPVDLFDAPLVKVCIENMEPIKRTLEREARAAQKLIIWTDCDREGENIGFEIISVCKAIKPSLVVQRAKFSEITVQSVNRAMQTLCPPDERQNNAVEVRSELDLRIGASFTRFQTLRLQKVFPQALAQTLISYGSCQFPTLGFVVERYKAIEEFIPEQFWKLKVTHEVDNCVVEFKWRRVRLFDQLACQILHDKCLDSPLATVKSVKSKTKSRWRPLPLDTIELEKLGSRKLRLNAKETMRVAEKLYTSGYISYPRTETNIFPKDLELLPLVQSQTGDPNWGEFASRVANNGPTPRQGKKSDQAHPPIHPTKYAHGLSGNEKTVYEFIVRHFLACCDRDARGLEAVVDVDVAGEEFSASSLIILERNYLDVYPYDKWTDKEMPNYQQGQTFQPSSLDMIDGQTQPPPLLTEADLISLMEKHGIGTDATHADHIETIKTRMYVGLQDTRFVPGELGMGLVEGYDAMGYEMSKPNLRAELEADLKRICEGTKDPNVVLQEQVSNYKNVFVEALKQASKIDVALAKYLNEVPEVLPGQTAIPDIPAVNSKVMKCPSCQSDIVLKKKRDGSSFFMSCQGYPDCKVALWFPETVKDVEIMEESCAVCSGNPKNLKFTFSPRAYTPLLPSEYVACVGGCDSFFMETLDIQPIIRRVSNRSDGSGQNRSTQGDSGFGSRSSFTSSFQSNQSGLSTPPVLSNRTNTLPPNPQSRTNRNPSNPSFVSGPSEPRNEGSWSNGSSDPSGSWNQNYSSQRGSSRPVQRGRGSRTSTFEPNNRPADFGGSGSWRDGDDEGNAVVCQCNEDAVKLTVRKEGPNTGRQFYKCRLPQGQGCNFFLWADEGSDSSSAPRNSGSQWAPRGGGSVPSGSNRDWDSSQNGGGFSDDGGGFGDTSSVSCNCGIFAKRLTTLKEGPNKGRDFYVCSKVRDEQCGFFQWADETDSREGGFSHSARGTNQSGRGQGRGRGSTRGGGQKRKAPQGDEVRRRSCGSCGQQGHNRRNCPHK